MRFGLRVRVRVPIRLRFFFRAAFALLAFATLALAVTVLRDEKQRSQRDAVAALHRQAAQITARLRHPTGQLALLNAGLADRPLQPLRPLLLPFSSIDFDDRAKAQQAVEMAGCQLQYPDTATLCVAIGNNPNAGGFIYVVGSFVSGDLVAHATGDLDLRHADRIRIDVSMRGRHDGWVAPFEALPSDARQPGVHGRLTGYPADRPVLAGARPVRDFRGWLWQDGRCVDPASSAADCRRRSFVSVRLPIEVFRDDLYAHRLVWPPPDLDSIQVRVRMLAPDDGAVRFDSDTPGAELPFSLADLRTLLSPGDILRVRERRADGTSGGDLLTMRGPPAADLRASPWLERLTARLPIDETAAFEARDTIPTALGQQEIVLTGDVRALDRNLAVVATRLAWFVGAMLLAVLLTWLAIELRIIRRITLLTRRAAVVSTGMRASDDLARIDIADLRGSDELGVLAAGLADLLQRVNEDVRRERIRSEQARELWHAVGHEIMSPLQSLMALHGHADDASHRYIRRMQQAVRVLYGHASPAEAFEASQLHLQPIDLAAFLAHVAGNAAYIGIDDVAYVDPGASVTVQADEFPLEDAITHVLRNAQRHRLPGTPVRISLTASDGQAQVSIHNQGAPIPADMAGRIFEYGVSEQAGAAAEGQRGQGLFVARTYMAKMGGTITARNVDGGVAFDLVLPCTAD